MIVFRNARGRKARFRIFVRATIEFQYYMWQTKVSGSILGNKTVLYKLKRGKRNITCSLWKMKI